jgi:Zn finger protein HypA/HybF involved in hydrogenase expression
MANKIPEAMARLFHRKWVCKNCKTVMKADASKVRARKLICKNCQGKNFRLKTKEKKTIK